MEEGILPNGLPYTEVIAQNKHYYLQRNNVLEHQHEYFRGKADGKYYELYKYINYDEFFGGRAKRHLTFVKSYKNRGTALNRFNKLSSKFTNP